MKDILNSFSFGNLYWHLFKPQKGNTSNVTFKLLGIDGFVSYMFQYKYLCKAEFSYVHSCNKTKSYRHNF